MAILSDLAKLQQVTGGQRPTPTEMTGRQRTLVIDTEVAEAGKDIILATLPAGRFRILGFNSWIGGTLATTATTVSIGHAAYTGVDRQKVAAKPAALLAATAGSALATPVQAKVAGPSGLLFSAGSSVVITATASANLAVGDKIVGVLTYVND